MDRFTRRPNAGRPFGVFDGLVLVAATAAGLATIRIIEPDLTVESVQRALQEPTESFCSYGRATIAEHVLGLIPALLVPCLAAWSAAIVLLSRGSRVYRPGRRRRAPTPGLLACGAATFVAALCGTFPLTVRAISGSGWVLDDAPFLASIACEIGAGSAVFWCWVTLALCRRWWPVPTWTDRAGRALGMAWLLAGLAGFAFFIAVGL